MKIASFDIDAQKGFTPLCPDELPVPGGDAIAPALNQLAARASLRLGSKDAHSPQAAWVAPSHAEMLKPLPLANADLSWVSHCVPGTPGFELLDELPAPQSGPEQRAIGQLEWQRLQQALGELPERTRTVFTMSQLEGYSQREVASHLSASPTLVHFLLRDALSHCRSRLEPEAA